MQKDCFRNGNITSELLRRGKARKMRQLARNVKISCRKFALKIEKIHSLFQSFLFHVIHMIDT